MENSADLTVKRKNTIITGTGIQGATALDHTDQPEKEAPSPEHYSLSIREEIAGELSELTAEGRDDNDGSGALNFLGTASGTIADIEQPPESYYQCEEGEGEPSEQISKATIKTKRVKPPGTRCTACRRSGAECSNQRPCLRCVALGKDSSCRDKPERYPGVIRCNYCRRHNLKCSEERPCQRCIGLGIGDSCSDKPVRKSKKSSKKICCYNCQEDSVHCSSIPPCPRCVKLGIGEICIEVPSKGQLSGRCFACERSKSKCDEERPCNRCVSLGQAELCRDLVVGNPKKRKREPNYGNGPYKVDSYRPYKEFASEMKRKKVDKNYDVFVMNPSALENPLPVIHEKQSQDNDNLNTEKHPSRSTSTIDKSVHPGKLAK